MFAAFAFPLPLTRQLSFTSNPLQFSPPLTPLHFRRCLYHQPFNRSRSRASISCVTKSSTTEIKVGEIVGVDIGGKISIAKVTGVDGTGKTADILLLDQFVKELYVESEKAVSSYERVEKLRKVKAEWIPEQEGWIVLDVDRDACKKALDDVAIARMSGIDVPEVVVREADKRKLGPEALERQGFPMPSKRQAFIGAALSVPLATVLYAGYYNVKQSYLNVPLGDEAQNTATLRQAMLNLTGASAAIALLVGISLLLLGLSSTLDKPERNS